MVPPSATVEDVTFPSGIGDTRAWLVEPAERGGDRSRPAVLMWHWLDTEAPDGNRDEFLDEARELAVAGVVSLLPEGRFPWSIDPSEVTRSVAGVDLLARRQDVDPARIAAVGHDFGAMYAVLAAARDPRVGALALLAPTPRWGDWLLPFWRIDEDRIAYLAALRPLDPVEKIGRLAPRPILLQLATRDFYLPVMAGYELRRAAGGDPPVELRTYEAGHDLKVPDAGADRRAFLDRVLRLGGAGTG